MLNKLVKNIVKRRQQRSEPEPASLPFARSQVAVEALHDFNWVIVTCLE